VNQIRLEHTWARDALQFLLRVKCSRPAMHTSVPNTDKPLQPAIRQTRAQLFFLALFVTFAIHVNRDSMHFLDSKRRNMEDECHDGTRSRRKKNTHIIAFLCSRCSLYVTFCVACLAFFGFGRRRCRCRRPNQGAVRISRHIVGKFCTRGTKSLALVCRPCSAFLRLKHRSTRRQVVPLSVFCGRLSSHN
jgi:hypothetical protein